MKLSSWKYRLAAVPKTAVIVILGIIVNKGLINQQALQVIILCCSLWLLLYLLNEVLDAVFEEKLVVPRAIILGCATGIIGIISISYFIKPMIGLLFSLMSASQMAYCCPPLRWKRYVWAGPLLSGAINPILRFLVGINLSANQDGKDETILLSLILLVAFHFASALKTKVYQTNRDRRAGYQTIPIGFIVRYIEPLQLLTPIAFGLLCWLLYLLVKDGALSSYAQIVTLPLTLGAIAIIWQINDHYDRERHRLANAIKEYVPDTNLIRAEKKLGPGMMLELESMVGTSTIQYLRSAWMLRFARGAKKSAFRTFAASVIWSVISSFTSVPIMGTELLLLIGGMITYRIRTWIN